MITERILVVPVGKIRNYQLWTGKGEWVFGGALYTGTGFWKTAVFLGISVVSNVLASIDFKCSKEGRDERCVSKIPIISVSLKCLLAAYFLLKSATIDPGFIPAQECERS